MYPKNLSKHYFQIKDGGIKIFMKKINTLIFIIFIKLPVYFISIPIFIILTLIRPWYLIRWKELNSSRLGEFAMESELYCCERDANINFPKQKYKDFFYLKDYICNKTIEKMWRRKITILPSTFIKPIHDIGNFFLGKNNIHEIKNPIRNDRDFYNLLEKFETHVNFTSKQELKGKEILKILGLPKNSKFVCLIVRDRGYLSRYENIQSGERWRYHDYRDGDIENYVMATEELAKRGYYVFRMGINVLKPLKSANPKIIDYANSEIRSDFMDVYLGANCSFCISTACGFDAIPHLFRKPIATITVPMGTFWTTNQNFLLLTKHHINKIKKKELSISEIFSSKAALTFYDEEFKDINVELQENTPEEIRDLAIEMDERINKNWKETNEDILLQKNFKSIYEKNIKDSKWSLGKVRANFSAKYLRDNKHLIN